MVSRKFALALEQAFGQKASDGRLEAQPVAAFGRMPSIRRRPTKNLSSSESARVDRDAGIGPVAFAHVLLRRFHVLARVTPSKECASAPKPTYGSSRQYFRLCADSKPGRAKFEIS